MKRILLITFLLLSFLAYGQLAIDTIDFYNGIPTKKRIEKDSRGNTRKEIYYYSNGKVQIIYFFENGKQVHWISYNEAGIKESEWIDPEIENKKHARFRNVVFVVTFLLLALVLLSIKRFFGYQELYYFSIFFAALIAILCFWDATGIPVVDLTVASLAIILPLVLITLSIFNLIFDLPIPKLVSACCILGSFILALYIIIAISVAGAGMLS